MSKCAGPEMPANTVAIALLLGTIGLLVLQPDFGQTMLVVLVWAALFFMAGVRWIWVIGLAGTAVAGLAGAYLAGEMAISVNARP
jgi:cell division protein FtsW